MNDDDEPEDDDERTRWFSAHYLDTVEHLDRFLRVRGWSAVRAFDRNDRRPGYQWEWPPTLVRPWHVPATVWVWDNLPIFEVSYPQTELLGAVSRERFETLFELKDRLQMVEGWPSKPTFDTSERSAFIRRTQAADAANQHTEAFPITELFAVELDALRAQFRNAEIDAPTYELEAMRVTADAYMAYRGSLQEQAEQ